MERFTVPSVDNDWAVPWDELQSYSWVQAWKDCPQDPVHHAEGNVWIHTRMVLEEMAKDPVWRALSERDRALAYVAAILHDVAKPLTTTVDDPEPGRVSARGHSPKGATMARQILWEMECPFAFRELVCGMILHHQVPYYLINEDNSEKRLTRISYTTRCDLLQLLANADIRGRICEDLPGVLEKIELFGLYAEDLDCMSKPVSFASDHTRFKYFNTRGVRSIHDVVFDETWGEVIVMSGLPGSGKGHWIRENAPDLPVVSMDAMRRDAGVKHGDKAGQGRIRQAAVEQAKVYLRAQQPFVWDATNLDRNRRRPIIQMCDDYGARIHIAYVEASGPSKLFQQNRDREYPIPEDAITKMVHGRWEIPSLMEAQRVTYAVDGVNIPAQNVLTSE